MRVVRSARDGRVLRQNVGFPTSISDKKNIVRIIE